MTGGGRGFCVLKVHSSPRERLTGFTGVQGRPVGSKAAGGAELRRLRLEAYRIEAILCDIRNRIERLQAARQKQEVGV